MVLSTQEKSFRAATLRYSYPQTELFSEITKNLKGTIDDAANFSKLHLALENLFEHLPSFQKDFYTPQMSPL